MKPEMQRITIAEALGWIYPGMCTATAAQRAEAFLKTIGKWEEES